MKSYFSIAGLSVWLFATGFVTAADTKIPVETKPGQIKSVFIQPKKFIEGRDPFFPESTRVFQAVMAENSSHNVEVTTLSIKGYYRDSSGAYVIINNHTFTVGDEGDVVTPGGRVHIRCVDILPSVVVIEYSGSMHQLPINGAKK